MRASADFSNPNIGYPGSQMRLHDDAAAETFGRLTLNLFFSVLPKDGAADAAERL